VGGGGIIVNLFTQRQEHMWGFKLWAI
jgi:hypothetical protein